MRPLWHLTAAVGRSLERVGPLGVRSHESLRRTWANGRAGIRHTCGGGRWPILILFLLGLFGFQNVVPEIGMSEIVEHVVSIDARTYGNEFGHDGHRRVRLRKCWNLVGSQCLPVKRACRLLSGNRLFRPLGGGHRRPDNSLAPLRI